MIYGWARCRKGAAIDTQQIKARLGEAAALARASAIEFARWVGPASRLFWRQLWRRENLPFAGLPAFWLAVLLLQLLPFSYHGLRSLLIVLIVAGVILSLRLGEDRHPLGTQRGQTILFRVVAGLAACHLLFCLVAVFQPDLGATATTTLAAGRIIMAGGNPYAEPADPEFAGALIVEGYKLPPVTAIGFMPLGLLLGPRGIVLTNLVLQGLVVAAMFAVARGSEDSARHRHDGALAVILYLALPVVPFEVFMLGSPDLLAVLLALLGILLADRRSLFGGLAAGLSVSAGLLPGALILPLCLPATTRGRENFAAGLAMGVLPMLIFFVRAPEPFMVNVIELGPAGGGSATGLGPVAAHMVQTVASLLWFGLGVLAWRRPLELEQRCGLAAITILSAMLLMPGMRSGEILWWLPLAAIAVARPALLALTALPDPAEALEQANRMEARLQGLARTHDDRPGG